MVGYSAIKPNFVWVTFPSIRMLPKTLLPRPMMPKMTFCVTSQVY